jgi:geranyl-CoA carboxylase alpha subunit
MSLTFSGDCLLIANRGEIACRVIRSARALGFLTVAVYSDADRDAPHVALADRSVHIGPTESTQSYLNIDRLISVAHRVGAGAIHPGYGFLSENPLFAERCEAEGIKLIGPSAQAMRVMGDKRAARIVVAARGVTCVPGYDGEDQSTERLLSEAERIGVPLMVKATMGGGGKGMRLVYDLAEVEEALKTAQREATAAFGSGGLILERAIERPRHIEIQVFADQAGGVVHLGERECSLQRRNQKVIEEAPSIALSESLRAEMGRAAVEVARSVEYEGAGTVEFLLDPSGAFYFLEMNTRIQVEHPVTEETYGVDLVDWQLKIARGAPIPMSQDEIDARRRGHAIEARLYAEDPAQNFMPCAGDVHLWSPPRGEGIRVDAGVSDEVSAFYDPMVAKIIAYGPDRETARRRLLRALDHTLLYGPTHNLAFLKQLLSAPAFVSGEIDTRSIDRDLSPTLRPLAPHWLRALAAVLLSAPRLIEPRSALGADETSSGVVNDGWGSARQSSWPVELSQEMDGFAIERAEGDEADLPSTPGRSHWQVTQLGEGRFKALLMTPGSSKRDESNTLTLTDVFYSAERSEVTADVGGTLIKRHARLDELDGRATLWISTERADVLQFTDTTYALTAHREEDAGDGRVLAPMNGKLLAVRCEVGQAVSRGDQLFTLEAMKLEHAIIASIDGVIAEVCATVGDQVKPGQQLATITSTEEESPT